MSLSVLDFWFGPPADDPNPVVRRGHSGDTATSLDPVTAGKALSAEDTTLLDRLRSADEALASRTLEQLHMTWAAPLARYVERLTHSADVADDIVQDVFLTVWARRQTVMSFGSARAYLFGAVHRRALQWMRNTRTAHRWADRAAAELATASPALAARVPQTDARAAVRELAAILHTAIATLSPRQREALLLYRERDLSLAEVAEVMGTSINTVKVQLQRAGATLREVVERYFE